MKHEISKILEPYFSKIKIDKAFYTKVRSFRLGWVNKGDIYIEFLGGNLTGVHPIRFSSLDEEMFYVDVLVIDEQKLKQDIYRNSLIHTDRKVSSNVAYISLLYLMHRTILSKDIGKLRDSLLEELYYIFAYKVLGSLSSHYFKHDVKEEIAKAVYDRLSNRFLIKRFGSWQKVLEHRVKDILPTKGINYTKLLSFKTFEVELVIADMQGRIRDIIKNIYTILKEVLDNNEKITSTTAIEADEDGEKLKDMTGTAENHIRYTRSIVQSRNDFISDDIVYLITTVIKNVEENKLKQTLLYISENYNKLIKENDFLETAIISTITYLRTKGIVSEYNKNAYTILKHMKGYWSSSSVKDKNVHLTKKQLIEITRNATGKRTKWVLTSVTISVLMYIFIRSLYKK